MKTVFLLLLVMLIGSWSCKKNESLSNIIGKWKYCEYSNAYHNGGSFQWHPISSADEYIYEFKDKNVITTTQITACERSGSYKRNNNALTITLACNNNSGLERKYTITSLTNDTLILELPVDEGYIRYKYFNLR